jgi:hypothetical protein
MQQDSGLLGWWELPWFKLGPATEYNTPSVLIYKTYMQNEIQTL